MLSKLLQEQAALYVAGVMTAQQREQFELVIEFHDELREFAGGLAEIGTVITLATLRRGDAEPSPATKTHRARACSSLPM